MNLVSFRGFMEKPNSIVILNCRSCLINNYLAKGFYIIEKYSKQLILLPNDVILRINMIIQMDTDFGMAKYRTVSAVANTIKTLHIKKNMHLIYK